jgi:hypothetical protein
MSARFRARAPGPVSGQLCSAPGGRAGHDGAGFLLPFGRRHSLLGHPVPPGDSAPLAIGLPRRPQAARTRAGFPCSARVRHDRDRVLSVPRGRRRPHGQAQSPAAARRLPAAGPVTPAPQPVPGCAINEASARVHWRSPPPGLPLACDPRTDRGPLGFPVSSAPASPGDRHARHGGDRSYGADLGYVSGINRPSSRRSHSPRATSCRNCGTA